MARNGHSGAVNACPLLGVNGFAGPRVFEPASDGCRDQSDDGKVANPSTVGLRVVLPIARIYRCMGVFALPRYRERLASEGVAYDTRQPMAERNAQQAQQARDELRHIVGFSVADEITKLDQLKKSGSITDVEYGRLRAKLV
jgi:hypothetical protein